MPGGFRARVEARARLAVLRLALAGGMLGAFALALRLGGALFVRI